jgi:uncharacterized protein
VAPTFPYLGRGIGLRPPHYVEILEAERPPVDWFEVVTENFLGAGGNPRRVLMRVRERAPVVLHGVSLDLGSCDPLDEAYLDRLAALVRDVEPALVSDHACWGSHGGRRAHDLWPLPYNEESLAHVCARVARVQERLGRRIAVENVSAYAACAASAMAEHEWLAELARRADCGLLVDVNNVHVSARNLGFDARAYLAALPAERIAYVHLAGHADRGTHYLDTHDAPVCAEVRDLHRELVARVGPRSTLVEWDGRLPPLARLVAEAHAVAA